MSFAVAVLRFGAGSDLLALSQGKAGLLSIWVLYIIWAALFLFHLVNETGSIETIGKGISRVTRNRVMQLVLLAWVFTTFLQGIAGYGLPVAVASPLMVGLGFSPVTAVVATSVGHSWAVTFGSLGASFYALTGVSGMEGSEMAFESALLLGVACFLCGFCAVWAYGGRRALQFSIVPLLVVGSFMAGTQLLLAVIGAYSLASFTAGCVGLVVVGAFARTPRFRMAESYMPEFAPQRGNVASIAEPEPASLRQILVALSAYLLLVAIVLIASLVEPVGEALSFGAIEIAFPETSTSYSWTNEAMESFRTIEPLGDAGALLLYASALGYLVYRRAGLIKPGMVKRAAANTVNGALGSSLGIVAMVGMALLMMESGMTFLLARGIVEVAGPVFPLLAPLVGVLGAFMTGSNTNSNILFGALQRDSARLLDISPAVLLGSQTTGGALGSIAAPAKVIVGSSTVGLSGAEGYVIRQNTRFALLLSLLISAVTLVWSVV